MILTSGVALGTSLVSGSAGCWGAHVGEFALPNFDISYFKLYNDVKTLTYNRASPASIRRNVFQHGLDDTGFLLHFDRSNRAEGSVDQYG